MKTLSTSKVIELITNGSLNLRQSLTLASTPKQYVIFIGNDIYSTDDLERTKARLLKDHANKPANEVILVDAKEYQEHLLTVK